MEVHQRTQQQLVPKKEIKRVENVQTTRLKKNAVVDQRGKRAKWVSKMRVIKLRKKNRKKELVKCALARIGVKIALRVSFLG